MQRWCCPAARGQARQRSSPTSRARADRAVAVAGDVTDEAHARQLVAAAVEHFGGLDFAVNTVGGFGEAGPLPGISLAGWRATLDLNLTSAFLGAKYQVPAMLARGGGAIVFVSSFVGQTVAIANTAGYAAAKAGLEGLATTIAVEYGARRIRANVLVPGGTDTPRMSRTRRMRRRRSARTSSECTRFSGSPVRTKSHTRHCSSCPMQRASSRGRSCASSGGVSIAGWRTFSR